MSKKGFKPDDMLDYLSDERVANMVVARLEKCLAPIVERLLNSLAAEFTSKLESISSTLDLKNLTDADASCDSP